MKTKERNSLDFICCWKTVHLAQVRFDFEMKLANKIQIKKKGFENENCASSF